MKIALGVTGCIAAYKAIEVMRELQRAGVEVEVILTRAAREFVTPLTFEALSGRSVITDMFTPGANLDIQHIRLSQEIRLLAVVPATANIMAKFAHGIADDFLSTVYLSCPAPVLIAPAMNVEMWAHSAMQDNLSKLETRNHHIVYPAEGDLACRMEGMGRLASVEVIVSEILKIIKSADDLSGVKVLVTAGPTVEDLDPVRFLSNRSSGKMGFAIAQAASRRGAEVVLITGPTSIKPPNGVEVVHVRTALDMNNAVQKHFDNMDIVIKAAAVTDFRPSEYSSGKIKKHSASSITLTPTNDILAELGTNKKNQILVGFAAETVDLISNAKDKMSRKNCDLMVVNDVTEGVFGEDSATVHIIDLSGQIHTLENTSKIMIGDKILDMAYKSLCARKSGKKPTENLPT